VPINDSALLSVALVKGATLKVYPGAPHGLCSTLKNQVNADLLAFIQSSEIRSGFTFKRMDEISEQLALPWQSR